MNVWTSTRENKNQRTEEDERDDEEEDELEEDEEEDDLEKDGGVWQSCGGRGDSEEGHERDVRHSSHARDS